MYLFSPGSCSVLFFFYFSASAATDAALQAEDPAADWNPQTEQNQKVAPSWKTDQVSESWGAHARFMSLIRCDREHR